jgi:hypothetical protein
MPLDSVDLLGNDLGNDLTISRRRRASNSRKQWPTDPVIVNTRGMDPNGELAICLFVLVNPRSPSRSWFVSNTYLVSSLKLNSIGMSV